MGHEIERLSLSHVPLSYTLGTLEYGNVIPFIHVHYLIFSLHRDRPKTKQKAINSQRIDSGLLDDVSHNLSHGC